MTAAPCVFHYINISNEWSQIRPEATESPANDIICKKLRSPPPLKHTGTQSPGVFYDLHTVDDETEIQIYVVRTNSKT